MTVAELEFIFFGIEKCNVRTGPTHDDTSFGIFFLYSTKASLPAVPHSLSHILSKMFRIGCHGGSITVFSFVSLNSVAFFIFGGGLTVVLCMVTKSTFRFTSGLHFRKNFWRKNLNFFAFGQKLKPYFQKPHLLGFFSPK